MEGCMHVDFTTHWSIKYTQPLWNMEKFKRLKNFKKIPTRSNQSKTAPLWSKQKL